MQQTLSQPEAPGESFAGYERQTARKVALSWLAQGQWVKLEGKEPSYVLTPHGEKVSRCRVLATVVQVFVSEDGKFASVTLDDGTDTIRAKAFRDRETGEPTPALRLLQACAVGQLVDVTGKVREYNGEVYLIPEAIAAVEPNAELLRRLELLQLAPAAAAAGSVHDDARAKILEALAGADRTYEELIAAAGDEASAERAITALLEEGVCYEPTPGRIRKI